VQGWSWYTGADATAVGAGQYDFETIVMHELGHSLGLGHSADPDSVMYATLGTGTARRALSVADLDIPDLDNGPCGLHAAGTFPEVIVPSAGPAIATPAASALGGRGHAALIFNVLTSPLSAAQGAALPTGLEVLSAVPNGGGAVPGTGAHGVGSYLHGGGELILVGGEGDTLVLGPAGRDVLVGGIGSASHQGEHALRDPAEEGTAVDGGDAEGPFDYFGAIRDSGGADRDTVLDLLAWELAGFADGDAPR
jgi:hypothetical protein